MWHVQLVGLPVQPCFNVLDRRLRWATPHYQCPGRVWASPGDVLSPAFGQMGEPHCYPSVYQKDIPRVLYRATHLDLAPPPVPKRLPSSLAYACSGTSGICPRTDSMGSYCCNHGARDIGYPLPPYLASQCHIPAHGQPPVLVGEPFCPLRGPYGVDLPSF